MEYHYTLPVDKEKIKKLKVGDILYLTGKIFTARDETHHIMLEKDKVPFDPSEMALFHCGPLMKKDKGHWHVISAGPTTSSRMEIFEDEFIKKFGTNIIIGKGGMGERTENALQKYTGVYVAYTLEELGMPEAAWIFKVKEFGPLIVAIDSYGESIYKKLKKR